MLIDDLRQIEEIKRINELKQVILIERHLKFMKMDFKRSSFLLVSFTKKFQSFVVRYF